MKIRIASWNVNSIRLRLDHIAKFAALADIDVLCFQEIKCQTPEFPYEALSSLGFSHFSVRGQKGWHGVAIASRLPFLEAPDLDPCREGHARSVGIIIQGVEIQTLYIPAGGDIADRLENPKFDHKLDFLERLTDIFRHRDPARPLVLNGDFNVAPAENDVWNHRHMLKIVSHTPIEIETLLRLKSSLGFIDVIREAVPETEKLYSWWSYRARDFRESNRGLRLDHMWVSPGLAPLVSYDSLKKPTVYDDVRGWDRPSDHVPVVAEIRV